MSIPCDPDDDCKNDHLRSHYEDPFHEGVADRVTHVAEEKSPLQEDSVQITLTVEGESIEEAWFQAEGCLVCQAAASSLCESVEGFTIEEARGYGSNDHLVSLGEPLPPNRRRCALLPWRIFQRALDQTPPGESDEDEGLDGGNRFGGPSLREES